VSVLWVENPAEEAVVAEHIKNLEASGFFGAGRPLMTAVVPRPPAFAPAPPEANGELKRLKRDDPKLYNKLKANRQPYFNTHFGFVQFCKDKVRVRWQRWWRWLGVWSRSVHMFVVGSPQVAAWAGVRLRALRPTVCGRVRGCLPGVPRDQLRPARARRRRQDHRRLVQVTPAPFKCLLNIYIRPEFGGAKALFPLIKAERQHAYSESAAVACKNNSPNGSRWWSVTKPLLLSSRHSKKNRAASRFV
jgi:hypothetical protein